MLGIGIDLVKVERIEKAIERWADSFTRRVFTPSEIAYCMGRRRPAESFAARFGAKEAAMKAFGTGLAGGVRWTDAEVVRGEGGRPELALRGRLGEMAREAGVDGAFVSLSHDREYAVAQVILTVKR